MSDYDALTRARDVIHAWESGAYDQERGITPEQRDVLDRAASDGRLSIDDFRTLVALGEWDLAISANDNDRIETDQEN